MDERAKQKLIDRGLLATTPSGLPAVRVSLQYRPRFHERSRSRRRELLADAFDRIASWLEPRGAEVDLDTLSVSGQTVEALLPVDDYDELAGELERAQIRIDELFDRQVV